MPNKLLQLPVERAVSPNHPPILDLPMLNVLNGTSVFDHKVAQVCLLFIEADIIIISDDIMYEVFRAMKALDFEWKMLNAYHVIVRRRVPNSATDADVSLYLLTLHP